MRKIGSRAQVMHGNARMTGGGLRKKDLKYNKRGKIVSKKASKAAKKSNNLVKAGYVTKKGEFGTINVKDGGMFHRMKTHNVINMLYETVNNSSKANIIFRKLMRIIKKSEKGLFAHSIEKKIDKIGRLFNGIESHMTYNIYRTLLENFETINNSIKSKNKIIIKYTTDLIKKK